MTNHPEFMEYPGNAGRAEGYLLPSEEPVQLIAADGSATGNDGYKEPYQLPGPATLVEGYGRLVMGRRVNEQANALVRQGRMAVYPSSTGQEACQVAADMSLRGSDWLFPTYRDTVAILGRGVDPMEAFESLRGDWHSGFDPHQYNTGLPTTPLATQLLHAVGVAHAAKLRGEDTVVLTLCGDGASSEGDFHEALNFAAVFHVPVVFLIQNNQYAISVPLIRQSVAPSLAHKAVGYGMPGERVDGNDLAALLAVVGHAVERARNGGGPSLVEAHTYRMESHTNADDATRYRTAAEVAQWVPKDPLLRLQKYLHDAGHLAPADSERFAADAEAVAKTLRDGLNTETVPDPAELFSFVYSEPTPQLREQARLLADELAAGQSLEGALR
ncbi:pyruvate dehydrogenase E1 component alpha subunit [Arthrobacter silviterrae]|uniref:2-oxoisovalerate dehydrogenase subunit alpha n=1 Tax=Arthrobacter silviterrae TaxID=2026658 RepID=A0ABX0DAZ9_9MICC|nr:thiamine pyrophosphate-dependent dehydrogenase E1 component subunit alpha [Arthrobacter silviterrae]MDQ0277806.1 pyruvate dehydrogenase E1 component alpha subunit [Arthrobacter silviterrae]NGN83828.1 thiamine pyrophosphate-dependent dehydrogenase E1 component subunit alpha [Arthrobacter silviterrae]